MLYLLNTFDSQEDPDQFFAQKKRPQKKMTADAFLNIFTFPTIV